LRAGWCRGRHIADARIFRLGAGRAAARKFNAASRPYALHDLGVCGDRKQVQGNGDKGNSHGAPGGLDEPGGLTAITDAPIWRRLLEK
jgi:hypothetical protein